MRFGSFSLSLSFLPLLSFPLLFSSDSLLLFFSLLSSLFALLLSLLLSSLSALLSFPALFLPPRTGASPGRFDATCGAQPSPRRFPFFRIRPAAVSPLSLLRGLWGPFVWGFGVPPSDSFLFLRWKSVYQELADYPWFVILGNHDFGNDDPDCLCPFFHERQSLAR